MCGMTYPNADGIIHTILCVSNILHLSVISTKINVSNVNAWLYYYSFITYVQEFTSKATAMSARAFENEIPTNSSSNTWPHVSNC